MSTRAQRVADELKHNISRIIQKELKNPLPGLVTITDIELSIDLEHAKIYFSVIGDEKQKKISAESLERATGFIRSRLAATVNMRHTPTLKFYLDESSEYGKKIDDLFKKIHEKEEK